MSRDRWLQTTQIEKYVVQKFNPNHKPAGPGGGQFASGGGGGGATPAAAPAPDLPPPPAKTTSTHRAPGTQDSLALYSLPNGQWKPERQKIHDDIVQGLVGDVPTSKNPTVYMTGGGSGAGKSTLLDSPKSPFPAKGKAVAADADWIKTQLPDFKTMKARHDETAGGYVHEESAIIARQALDRAAHERKDVILDGIGDSSSQKLLGKIAHYRELGMHVEAAYVTAPVEMALQRAEARGQATGRYVDPAVIKGTHAGVSKVFPELLASKALDRLSLFDTSTTTPRLMLRQEHGVTTVYDRKGYAAFLAKAKG